MNTAQSAQPPRIRRSLPMSNITPLADWSINELRFALNAARDNLERVLEMPWHLRWDFEEAAKACVERIERLIREKQMTEYTGVVSDCCGHAPTADIIEEMGFCPDCRNHCEFVAAAEWFEGE